MNFDDRIPATRAIHHTLAYSAIICMTALLILLCSCTECPDHECPSFPTAAPRQ